MSCAITANLPPFAAHFPVLPTRLTPFLWVEPYVVRFLDERACKVLRVVASLLARTPKDFALQDLRVLYSVNKPSRCAYDSFAHSASLARLAKSLSAILPDGSHSVKQEP